MKRRFPLQNRKKMIVTLIGMALAALFGWVESVIPTLFVSMPFAKVQLAIFCAIFVAACYTPLEGGLTWAVRCIVFGLCVHSGAWLLVDLFAGIAALVVVWLLLRTAKCGMLTLWPVYGVVFAFVSCCAYCIMFGNGQGFTYFAQLAVFVSVNAMIWFVGAIVAIRLIPEKLLIDTPITEETTIQ